MELLKQINENRIQWASITPEYLRLQLQEGYTAASARLREKAGVTVENALQFYHELLMGPSKLAVIADHLNSLVPGYLEVQVEADRLSTEFSTALYQDEELKTLLERCVPKNDVEARFKLLHLRKFRK